MQICSTENLSSNKHFTEKNCKWSTLTFKPKLQIKFRGGIVISFFKSHTKDFNSILSTNIFHACLLIHEKTSIFKYHALEIARLSNLCAKILLVSLSIFFCMISSEEMKRKRFSFFFAHAKSVCAAANFYHAILMHSKGSCFLFFWQIQ